VLAARRQPNGVQLLRNSESCPLMKFSFRANTGRLTPLRFKLRMTIIAIPLTMAQNPEQHR
jgi:hypothetical protein